jgi:tetratricopeptide (TPR) repeat protein
VKLAENYSNAMYFLGLTYDKLGDKQKALEQFQKVSDLNPDNADVKKIVSNLQAGKKALDGLDQTTGGQNPNGDNSQNQSIQRDQQPVPPNTPIGPSQGQDQNPNPSPPNPAP